MLLTRELDEKVRRAEIAGIRGVIATVQRLFPALRADSIDVAGGLVAFAGVNSPLSGTYGVAAATPLAAGDIARISEFYETRNATPRVLTTPLTDPALARGLAAAGYVPHEYENVLAADERTAQGERDERIGQAADLSAWARASAGAYLDGAVLEPGDEDIGLVLASSDGVVPLEARDGGEIVATAALDCAGECAALFAGSTMPDHRGRGWHLALIRDRVARARDIGARLFRATAQPDGTSERNFHRCGFTTLYTRVLWERKVRKVEP